LFLLTPRDGIHSATPRQGNPRPAARTSTFYPLRLFLAMNWFYESAGQQQGPVSDGDLDRLLAEGRITPATLVWREGLTDWQPLSQARPAAAAPGLKAPPLESGAEGEVVSCASCGRIFPVSDVVQIGHRPICPDCKPGVLQGLQQAGSMPLFAGGERTEPAWERRAQLGIFDAAWQTIRDVLTKPAEVFARMRREGGLGGPLLFYVLVGTIGNIASFAYQWFVQMAGMAAGAQSQQTPNPVAEMMFTGVGMAVIVVLMPLFIAVGAFVYGGILHLSLMICGGAKQPFETTFRVHSYAAGAVSALMVIPFCGSLVAGVWSLVATIIGLSKAHEISTGRAVWAALLPMIFCCTLIAVIIGIAAAVGFSAASAGR
jgi:hypothetical protein